MRKRYRRRVPTIEAEQFRPDLMDLIEDDLPEGVEESLTSGKYWLRNAGTDRQGGRTYAGGIPLKPFDFIVIDGEEKVVMSPEEFKLAYEEV